MEDGLQEKGAVGFGSVLEGKGWWSAGIAANFRCNRIRHRRTFQPCIHTFSTHTHTQEDGLPPRFRPPSMCLLVPFCISSSYRSKTYWLYPRPQPIAPWASRLGALAGPAVRPFGHSPQERHLGFLAVVHLLHLAPQAYPFHLQLLRLLTSLKSQVLGGAAGVSSTTDVGGVDDIHGFVG